MSSLQDDFASRMDAVLKASAVSPVLRKKDGPWAGAAKRSAPKNIDTTLPGVQLAETPLLGTQLKIIALVGVAILCLLVWAWLVLRDSSSQLLQVEIGSDERLQGQDRTCLPESNVRLRSPRKTNELNALI